MTFDAISVSSRARPPESVSVCCSPWTRCMRSRWPKPDSSVRTFSTSQSESVKRWFSWGRHCRISPKRYWPTGSRHFYSVWLSTGWTPCLNPRQGAGFESRLRCTGASSAKTLWTLPPQLWLAIRTCFSWWETGCGARRGVRATQSPSITPKEPSPRLESRWKITYLPRHGRACRTPTSASWQLWLFLSRETIRLGLPPYAKRLALASPALARIAGGCCCQEWPAPPGEAG